MHSSSPDRSALKSADQPLARRRRGRLALLAWVAPAIVILLLASLGAASWYFSSQLLDVRPDRASYDLRVLALGRTTIKLPRTGSTERRGVYGLDWPGGRITLGSIVSLTHRTVVRHFSGSIRGLQPGDKVDFDVAVFGSPAELPAQYQTVSVPDPIGLMPAWYIPGQRHVWAILVHGYKANRTDPLRAVPALIALGLPILDISYRNDAGAPASPDHLYHLGASEWHDLEAGVRFALAHHAHAVVLYGFSLGGGIVESFMYRSHFARRVAAVVLDAPALDWNATIDLAASQRGLPSVLATTTGWVVAWRIGIPDLGAINAVSRSDHLLTPTLIFHGQDDQLVPIGPSVILARARPDYVSLYSVSGAGHTESWNVDPARYKARVDAFLSRVLKVPSQGSGIR